jgi:hypothetical protein
MGNRRLHHIECIHTLDMPESDPLEVTALNLFHPTASPLFEKVSFFHIMTQSPRRELISYPRRNSKDSWGWY